MIWRLFYVGIAVSLLLVGGQGAWMCFDGRYLLMDGLLVNRTLFIDFMMPPGVELQIPGRAGWIGIISATLLCLLGSVLMAALALRRDKREDQPW